MMLSHLSPKERRGIISETRTHFSQRSMQVLAIPEHRVFSRNFLVICWRKGFVADARRVREKRLRLSSVIQDESCSAAGRISLGESFPGSQVVQCCCCNPLSHSPLILRALMTSGLVGMFAFPTMSLLFFPSSPQSS